MRDVVCNEVPLVLQSRRAIRDLCVGRGMQRIDRAETGPDPTRKFTCLRRGYVCFARRQHCLWLATSRLQKLSTAQLADLENDLADVRACLHAGMGKGRIAEREFLIHDWSNRARRKQWPDFAAQLVGDSCFGQITLRSQG